LIDQEELDLSKADEEFKHLSGKWIHSNFLWVLIESSALAKHPTSDLCMLSPLDVHSSSDKRQRFLLMAF
jgi:hypothetical protein